MTDQPTLPPLSEEEKQRAHRLLRNFLVALFLAVVVEVLIRLYPNLLAGRVERQWLEWLVVSFIGVCAYLVWNVAIWYRRPTARFKDHTPWYRATAAKGPIIALVILLALTNISFQIGPPAVEETPAAGEETEVVEETTLPVGEEVAEGEVEEGTETVEEGAAPADEEGAAAEEETGAVEEGGAETTATSPFSFGIDFKQASEPVLLVVAFILGFYSRFAQTLLSKIGGFIFGKLWTDTFSEEKDGKESNA